MGARGGHEHRRWRLSGHKKATIDVVRNDINVTPLVDVMLVLLIIFMLMTLIMGRGADITLPKGQNYSQEKDKMQPVISIDIAGNVFYEKDKLGPISPSTMKEMSDRVEAAWKAPKNPDGVGKIYFKVDEKVPYIKVYPVLEFLNKTMLMQSVDLAVAKESGEGQ
jgi:biopolymer transport protein TolR